MKLQIIFFLKFFILLIAPKAISQNFINQILIYKNERYPMLVCQEEYVNIPKKLKKYINWEQQISNTHTNFEIISYNIRIGLDVIFTKFKIVNDTGYAIIDSYFPSNYRDKKLFPDSLGIDENNQIIQHSFYQQKLEDTTTKRILRSFLTLGITSMSDQSTYIDNLKSQNIKLINPCEYRTDCTDFLIYYEVKVNKLVWKFSRVGLDYYKFNPKLLELKDNDKLIEIIRNIQELALTEYIKTLQIEKE